MAHTISGGSHGVAGHGEAHEQEHPGEPTYIKVAVILAIITVIEVAIYYLDLGHGVLVTALLFFSAIKFATVVGYFMHLKFDDRRLLYTFLGGLLLGGAILLSLDVLHDYHSIEYANDMLDKGAAPAGGEEH